MADKTVSPAVVSRIPRRARPSGEKVPWSKRHSRLQAIAGDVVFKGRRNLSEIEADPRNVRIGEGHLHDEIALRGADG